MATPEEMAVTYEMLADKAKEWGIKPEIVQSIRDTAEQWRAIADVEPTDKEKE